MPKISALTSATALDADDELYVVEDGNSRKASTEAVVKAGSNASGAAPVYACRAWVNFNGATGTIRASGNVSSVTRSGTGDYTINFATALPDANFTVNTDTGSVGGGGVSAPSVYTTTSVRVQNFDLGSAPRDDTFVNVVVFR